MSEEERWHPYYLATRCTRRCWRSSSRYGVALHDLEPSGCGGRTTFGREAGMLGDILAQGAWPDAQGLRALPAAVRAVACRSCSPETRPANLARNLWSFMIIFCGHFPMDATVHRGAGREREPRGVVLPSAARLGQPHRGKLFHILAGNLSFQIEHHLFPDLPAHRYAEISAEVSQDHRALRIPLQHRPAAQAIRQRRAKIGKLALPPSLPGRGGGEPDGVKDAAEDAPARIWPPA